MYGPLAYNLRYRYFILINFAPNYVYGTPGLPLRTNIENDLDVILPEWSELMFESVCSNV